jgi:hypothetical protein
MAPALPLPVQSRNIYGRNEHVPAAIARFAMSALLGLSTARTGFASDFTSFSIRTCFGGSVSILSVFTFRRSRPPPSRSYYRRTAAFLPGWRGNET